jgi:hypothetical protein
MLAKVAVIADKGNSYAIGTPGKIVELGLQHLEKYEIFIESQSNRRLIAKIEIDGKVIGEFIINSCSKLQLLGVPKQEGEFTFLAPGTPEFTNANLDKVSDYYLGIVEVTITPEQIEYNPGLYEKGITIGATRSGGTGLTGISKQDFKFGKGFPTDISKVEVSTFRLVLKNMEVKPITPVLLADMSVFDGLLASPQYDAVFTWSSGGGGHRFSVKCEVDCIAVSTLLKDLIKRGLIVETDRVDWGGGGSCVAYEMNRCLNVDDFFDKVKAALAHTNLNLRFVLSCD